MSHNERAAGTHCNAPGRDTNHTETVAQSYAVAPLATMTLAAFVDMFADAVAAKLGASRFISSEQIAEQFGIAPRAIKTARQRGELRGRRIGHAFMFERADVEQWIASRTPRGVLPRPIAANDDIGAKVARSLAAAGLVAKAGA